MITIRGSASTLLKRTIGIPTAVLVAGCTQTPSIQRETDSVPVSEIVERVKCEIWLATKDELSDPHFAFLKNWGATVDLTMSVDDQAGINPGVTIVSPLNSVTLANKGTFAQSFSLGLGAGVTGQANLTDTVSFSLALKELNSQDKGLASLYRRDNYYNKCQPFQDADLIGNLRLKEWVSETLKPVSYPMTDPLLTKGFHPTVKGGPSPNVKALAKTTFDTLKTVEVERAIKPAEENNTGDNSTKKEVGNLPLNTVRDAINAIDPNTHTETDIPQSLNDFVAKNADVLKNDHTVAGALNDLQKKIDKAKARSKAKVALNDPLDTISHQIQFIVTWTGSVTPAWTLFNIKGPNPTSGSFVSGQHMTTHQLLITMGSIATSPNGEKGINGDVQTVRTIQQFNGALQRLQIAPLQ